MSAQQTNAVGWFEIYVNDMPRAKKFYETVFSRSLDKLEVPGGELEMWSFNGDMTTYGATGALVKMEGMTGGGHNTIVYFSCEDCATEEARVIEVGGKVERPKFSIGQHGFCSLIVDTEGNMFGLHSMQ